MECLSKCESKSKDEIYAELDTQFVPVMSSAADVQNYIDLYAEDKVIILYFMYKNLDECYMSTSRMHINDLWPNAVYLPCNISPADKKEMEKIYELAEGCDSIVFINHTAPHKSNPVMQKRYGPEFGDYLVKNEGKFSIVEGNGDAFVEMSSDMLGTTDFSDITVIIVGVGGAGVLALYAIKEKNPKRIVLIDIVDKSELAKSVGAEYYSNISDADFTDLTDKDRFVIIDATTHHNKRDEKAFASDFVKKHDSEKNIFIDYNMFVDSKEYGVELATVTKDEFDEIVINSIEARDTIEKLF